MADNEHPPPARPSEVAGPEPAPAHPEQPAGPRTATPPPAGPPAAPTGHLPAAAPQPAAPPALRQPAEPVPIDAEQVRQFQQFQQFQELMRQQQEQGTSPQPGFLQPLGPPPPRRESIWRKALRPVARNMITWAVVALLLAGVAYWLIDQLPGSGPPESPGPPHVIGGQKAETNLIFETNPRSAVQRIYDDIAQGDATSACGRFTDEARAQFTDSFAEYGSTCDEVVGGLNAAVTPGLKSEYANPSRLTSIGQPSGDTMVVSSCSLGVTGGEPLGQLTVGKINDSVAGQWIVTGHASEPSCGGVSTPPTS